jgi:hypothetical protein
VHGVKGAFKIAAEPVNDDDPRTLRAHYDPKEPGDYIVAVRWSGTHVPGSPFNVNIRKKPKPKKVKLPSNSVRQVEGFDIIKESDKEAEEGSTSKQKRKEKKGKEEEENGKEKKSSQSLKQAKDGTSAAAMASGGQ